MESVSMQAAFLSLQVFILKLEVRSFMFPTSNITSRGGHSSYVFSLLGQFCKIKNIVN